ncbi:hypothetical protein [Spirosoma lituiforme]
MQPITFEHFTNFIRQHTGVSRKKLITPSTQFENDLGITGDDGIELLEAVEKHYGVDLGNNEQGSRNLFNLAPNESLFHGEGFSMPLWWFGFGQKPVVRGFTVGELYTVLQALQSH